MEANNQFQQTCRENFSKKSAEELLQVFNHEVGNKGWSYTRSVYLHELREAFLCSGINISCVSNISGGFNLSKKAILINNRLEIDPQSGY